MRIKVIVIFISIFLLLVSCTEDLLDRITTNNILPEVEKPVVKSFDKMQTIIIEWDKDEGADEYILYRSEVPDGNYKEIYSGTDLSYEDNVGGYEIGKFFYYKLTKKRESKEFDKSGYVCGVVASVVKDIYEDNNEESECKCIDDLNSVSGNIYYCADKNGNIICDTDWYSVTMNQGLYNLYIFDIENPEAETTTSLVKQVSLYSPSEIQYLSDGKDIQIYNRTCNEKKLNFKICFNVSEASRTILEILNNPYNEKKSAIILVSYTIKYSATFQIKPVTPN